MDKSKDEFRTLLDQDEIEMSVVFTDPNQPDNPVIFITEEFEKQTGYSAAESIGKNCRFLQGPDTDPNAVQAIRSALKAQTRFTIAILNYRKDGTSFVNRLRIRPLFNEAGKLVYFVGAQNPIS